MYLNEGVSPKSFSFKDAVMNSGYEGNETVDE